MRVLCNPHYLINSVKMKVKNIAKLLLAAEISHCLTHTLFICYSMPVFISHKLLSVWYFTLDMTTVATAFITVTLINKKVERWHLILAALHFITHVLSIANLLGLDRGYFWAPLFSDVFKMADGAASTGLYQDVLYIGGIFPDVAAHYANVILLHRLA